MGKGLTEFHFCDSRRLRKKPQDAQDDVTELFDLFDAHFWLERYVEFGFSKAVLSSSTYSDKQLHLIHHADDRLCVWTLTRKRYDVPATMASKSLTSQAGGHTWAEHNTAMHSGRE